jgi:hypothetical protein
MQSLNSVLPVYSVNVFSGTQPCVWLYLWSLHEQCHQIFLVITWGSGILLAGHTRVTNCVYGGVYLLYWLAETAVRLPVPIHLLRMFMPST